MNSLVDDGPADPTEAREYFEKKLRMEIDVWAVHEGLKADAPGFMVIDVRGPVEYSEGHIPGAINVPYLRVASSRWARHSNTMLVVYGAGPHCNRADRAAVALAALKLPVKTMIGGIAGWRQEGFELDTGK